MNIITFRHLYTSIILIFNVVVKSTIILCRGGGVSNMKKNSIIFAQISTLSKFKNRRCFVCTLIEQFETVLTK